MEFAGSALIAQKPMDRAELERQIEDLHPACFIWALGCCRRNRDDAEEVLQNVYLMIFDGKAKFDGRSTLKTWIFAVIRRASIAHRRRRFLRDTILGRLFGRSTDDGSEAEAPAAIEQSQTAARLRSALLQLARRQREVVELVFYHDMTVEQAAAAMETSVGSARVHYDRAKKRLRMLLGETLR